MNRGSDGYCQRAGIMAVRLSERIIGVFNWDCVLVRVGCYVDSVGGLVNWGSNWVAIWVDVEDNGSMVIPRLAGGSNAVVPSWWP